MELLTPTPSSAVRALFLVHLCATLFMTGVIWFVQVVHYPLFDAVGREVFSSYSRLHTSRTSWVVMLPMLVELATALWLLGAPLPQLPTWARWSGLALLVVIWLSTAALQVPMHSRLEQGFAADAHSFLVSTNWIRTVAWTMRAVLVGWMAQLLMR